MAFNRDRCRASLADADAETNANVLAELLDVCGEIARELHLELPDLVRGITASFADAHGLHVTHFECEKDSPDSSAFSTVVAMVSKWRKN